MTDGSHRQSSFLEGRLGGRPWTVPEGARGDFRPTKLHLGLGANPLEVAVAEATARPNVTDVRRLWERRHGNRPSPLLLVALYPDRAGTRAAVCGPVGATPRVFADLDPGQIERLASAALDEPDRHAATRLLNSVLPEAQSELPGIRNLGMFATHELRAGVPSRLDWAEACERARPAMAHRGRELVEALGYTVELKDIATSVLRVHGKATAVAVFLEARETPEGVRAKPSGLARRDDPRNRGRRPASSR
jgi:hypothetical protein